MSKRRGRTLTGDDIRTGDLLLAGIDSTVTSTRTRHGIITVELANGSLLEIPRTAKVRVHRSSTRTVNHDTPTTVHTTTGKR